ncbi:MAG: RNA recognition motif domain-containing protein [Candidatus Rokuibacteriota bacterium]
MAAMLARVYVGNLASEVTGSDLRGLFATYGQVNSAQVVMDSADGRSRGFGFVEMPGQAHAENAIRSLDGTLLKGRPIKVSRARPRDGEGSRGNPSAGWAVVGDARHRW